MNLNHLELLVGKTKWDWTYEEEVQFDGVPYNVMTISFRFHGVNQHRLDAQDLVNELGPIARYQRLIRHADRLARAGNRRRARYWRGRAAKFALSKGLALQPELDTGGPAPA